MPDPVWTEILTLAEVKTHLRVGSDTSEDSLITTYITAAREYVEGYQNRIYLSTDEEVTAETMTGIEKAAVHPHARGEHSGLPHLRAG